jgi:hypothetical protein
MPTRPTREERESKLKKRLETMPSVYEKVGIPTIGEKSAKVMDATDMLKDVFTLLDNNGVTKLERVKYLNFARKVYRLRLKYTGRALADEVAREIVAYHDRYPETNVDLLKDIATAVTGVGAITGAGAGAGARTPPGT